MSRNAKRVGWGKVKDLVRCLQWFIRFSRVLNSVFINNDSGCRQTTNKRANMNLPYWLTKKNIVATE